MTAITIAVNDLTLTAELNHSPTAQQILARLPIDFSGALWGDEIYGSIPVSAAAEEDAREDAEVGTLAYWLAGSAFCLSYGPTPASPGDQPRAASPVNIVGRVFGDATVLRQISSSPPVRIEKAA